MEQSLNSLLKMFSKQQEVFGLSNEYLLLKNEPTLDSKIVIDEKEEIIPKLEKEPKDTILNRTQKRELLKKLYIDVLNCQKCSLCNSRIKPVFGAGNVDAKLMVIGEAPGIEEDKIGLPFIDNAGELLTKMLKAINLDRDNDIFITNMLKCRPPNNRDPELNEIRYCKNYLEMQIEIIKPNVILLLGKFPSQNILGLETPLATQRGNVYSYKGIPTYVTYNPTSLLKDDKLKRPTWADLQRLQKDMERGVSDE